MTVLRDGVSAAGQLAVTDISSFTLPDTTGSPTLGNFSNVFARAQAIAIGAGTTAPVATHTGLEAEITTGGGGRRSGADVTTTLIDGDALETPRADEWASRLETTWTFTADFAVSETAFGNSGTANTGVHFNRQVFATPFDVVSTDLFNVKHTMSHAGSFVAGSATVAGGVIPDAGLKVLAQLLMDADATTKATGNGWESATNASPSKFDAIAVGSGAGPVARANTALATEIALNGFARRSGANVTGSLMREPELFDTDTFTNFAGDTVQWRTTFDVTGTQSQKEQGVFNAGSGGDMLIRQTYADALDWVDTDTFIPVIRMVSQ